MKVESVQMKTNKSNLKLTVLTLLIITGLGGIFLDLNLITQSRAADIYYIDIYDPTGDDTWYKGESYKIRWLCSSNVYSVKLTLWKGGWDELVIDDSVDCVADPQVNSFSWKVPTDLDDGDDYRIEVYCYCSGERLNPKSGYFTIATKKSITITKPTSNSQWPAGSTQTIEWEFEGPSGMASIALMQDDNQVTILEADIGLYKEKINWVISQTRTPGDYKIRMWDKRDSKYYFSDEFDITEFTDESSTPESENPLDPVITCDFTIVDQEVSGNCFDICINGNYAYLPTDTSNSVAVIDISDPTNPGTPSYITIDGNPSGVFVEGNYLFIGTTANYPDGRLAVVDISNPTSPGSPVYTNVSGGAYKICVAYNFAYIAGCIDFGYAVVDVSSPTSSGTVYDGPWGYEPSSILIDGLHVYLTDQLSNSNGLRIFEIDDTTPSYYDELATFSIPSAQDVFKDSNYAYIASETNGLYIFDVSDLSTPDDDPVIVELDGEAYGVYVSDQKAYVALKGTNLIAIIDVSDPENPGNPVYFDEDGSGKEIIVKDDIIYIADSDGRLCIIRYECITSFPEQSTDGETTDGEISGDTTTDEGGSSTEESNEPKLTESTPFNTILIVLISLIPIVIFRSRKN